MILNKFKNRGGMPSWLPDNTHYLCIMGSFAYGVSSDTSDMDVYGWSIPPKEYIFPKNYIRGFGADPPKFEQWQEHHLQDVGAEKMYDFSVYNITKYFQLCMENNPNMIDSMFVPYNCIIHSTNIANMVRENNSMFLHKGCYQKFKGYAFAQLHKMKTKTPEEGSKRYENVQTFGFDSKYAYHLVRLLSECEEILTHGTLTLNETSRREHMKAIRRGEVSEADIYDWFASKEKSLDKLYHESKLQYKPDEAKIKNLLVNCLESHYGSIQEMEKTVSLSDVLLEMQMVIDKFKGAKC